MLKVKGHTLVETLIALTVIVVSISIGFAVFENLMQSSSFSKKVISVNELDNFIFSKAYDERNEIIIDDRIEYEIEESKEWPDCQKVRVSFYVNEEEVKYQYIYIPKK